MSNPTLFYKKSLFTNIDVPVVTLNAVEKTTSSLKLLGDVISLEGNASVLVYFKYRLVGGSTWTDTSKQTLTATGGFFETVTGLSINTEYEYYALMEDVNEVPIAEGEILVSQTKPDTVPTLSLSIDGFTFNKVTCSISNVNLDSGSNLEQGVVYSEASNPTVNDNKLVINSGSSEVISGLKSNTVYYIRGFVENEEGVGYSSEETITTLQVVVNTLTPGITNNVIIFKVEVDEQ